MVFAGDFNAHSDSWWIDGDANIEGFKLANTFSNLVLTQIISEPTHFRHNCNPTCIDLTLTDQPNLITSCRVRPFLDPYCKHQITFCNLNFKIPPLPPYKRLICHYNKAERELIERSARNFPSQSEWPEILIPMCKRMCQT